MFEWMKKTLGMENEASLGNLERQEGNQRKKKYWLQQRHEHEEDYSKDETKHF